MSKAANEQQALVAGVLLVLPEMVLDTFVIQFFEQIYTNMPSSQAATKLTAMMMTITIVFL
ncbi:MULTISPECIES: DUF5367 family protein [Sphingobacterium]|uniref:DUF5367 family protein n=1 Tax=Sphingobacterium TaxID=28453 RepID=UPI0035E40577